MLTSAPHTASRLSSEVERMAFNHVVVGSIPTDGVLCQAFNNLVFPVFYMA